MRSAPAVAMLALHYHDYGRQPTLDRRADAILGDVKWLTEKKAFDEAFEGGGTARSHYRPLVSILESFTQSEIERRERLQKLSLMDQGITFTVYGEKEGTERIFPFDFVPRGIPAREWERLQAGRLPRGGPPQPVFLPLLHRAEGPQEQ